MPDDKATNYADMQVVECEGLAVTNWHPQPDGAGKPEHVCILYKVAGTDIQMCLRLKSRRVLDEFIIALMTHGDEVWPPKKN